MEESDQQFASKVLDALTEVVKGTDWAPPEGGVLVDCLVVFVHVDPDGDFGSSWISHGSDEAAVGMATKVIRDSDSAALAKTIVTALQVWKGEEED